MFERHGDGTNLNLSEDRIEDGLAGTPACPRSNIWQKTKSVEGTGFDEHRGDDVVQPTGTILGAQGISNVPAMQD